MTTTTVDPETGEVTEVEDPLNRRQLPLFEGFRMEHAELTLSGRVTFTLWNEEDQELLRLLKLGKEVVLELHVGDRSVQIGAGVEDRSYTLKGTGRVPTARLRIKALDDGEGGL